MMCIHQNSIQDDKLHNQIVTLIPLMEVLCFEVHESHIKIQQHFPGI